MCFDEPCAPRRLGGMRRSSTFGALIALVAVCAIRAAAAQEPGAHHPRYANAERRFEQALFYKPERADGILSNELAVLVVVEASSNDTGKAANHPFGAVVLNASGEPDVDLARPTVYFDERRLVIRGREYTERLFALYARPRDRGFDAGSLTTVHLVLDADGFSLLGLIRDQRIQERRRCGYAVFVSEPLEEQARNRFGAPQHDRRYSIERGPRDQCSPVVPRVFAAGPIPMGPYIYLDKRGKVTTLLCRCSPSQMNDVLETREYRLEPIERVLAVRDKLSGLKREAFPIPGDAQSTALLIEKALRWPVEPATDAKPNEDR